jgi:hypothetical protein
LVNQYQKSKYWGMETSAVSTLVFRVLIIGTAS